MKNRILLLVFLAAVWYGWMWMVRDRLPAMLAHDFVKRTQMSVDEGVLRHNYNYVPPLPDSVFTVPPAGIGEDFTLERIAGTRPQDFTDSVTAVYQVRFKASPVAPPESEDKVYGYELRLEADGTYLWPPWKVVRFKPAR